MRACKDQADKVSVACLLCSAAGVMVSFTNNVTAWHEEQTCPVLHMVQKAALMSASVTTPDSVQRQCKGLIVFMPCQKASKNDLTLVEVRAFLAAVPEVVELLLLFLGPFFASSPGCSCKA